MPEYFKIIEGKVLISPVVTWVWLRLILFYRQITVKWSVGTNVNICSKTMTF